MESIADAEIIELILLQRQNVDFQFQFWLTITFAFIAAVYAVRTRIAVPLKVAVASLYLLATMSLVGRYVLEGIELARLLEVATDRALLPEPIGWPLIARALAVLVGTVGSTVYLFLPGGVEQASAGTRP